MTTTERRIMLLRAAIAQLSGGNDVALALDVARIGEFVARAERIRRTGESLPDATARMVFLNAIIAADGKFSGMSRTLSMDVEDVTDRCRRYGLFAEATEATEAAEVTCAAS